MSFETLGGEDGIFGIKALYLVYILGLYGFLFFGSIGASLATKNIIYFYIGFAFILGTVPFLVDNLTKERDALEELDTVSVEEPVFPIFTFKVQVVIGLVLGIFLFWKIMVTASAWVSSPDFMGIFESPIGGALLSMAAGICENHIFFGFVFPTAYAIISKRSNPVLAMILSLVITSILFGGTHWWKYRFQEDALVSTIVFSVVNCICVIVFRSLIISDFLHGVNNLAVSLGFAKKIALSVIF